MTPVKVTKVSNLIMQGNLCFYQLSHFYYFWCKMFVVCCLFSPKIYCFFLITLFFFFFFFRFICPFDIRRKYYCRRCTNFLLCRCSSWFRTFVNGALPMVCGCSRVDAWLWYWVSSLCEHSKRFKRNITRYSILELIYVRYDHSNEKLFVLNYLKIDCTKQYGHVC